MTLHDDARKAILKLRETADKAISGAVKLDDKLRMARLKKQLDKINRELITMVFDCEDAAEYVKNTIDCEECGTTFQA